MLHSLRPVVSALLVSLMLTAAPIVHAGTYTWLTAAPIVHAGTYTWQTTDANGNIIAQSPTFTGGTVSVVTALHPITRFPPPPPAFSTSNGQYSGGGGCVTSNVVPGGGPGCVKVNSPANPIVATFTWQASSPTDLPPPAVIVEQDCTAQWWAQTIPSPRMPLSAARRIATCRGRL